MSITKTQKLKKKRKKAVKQQQLPVIDLDSLKTYSDKDLEPALESQSLISFSYSTFRR